MTDPTQGQDQAHSATGVPKIALFWVYLLHHIGVEFKTDG